MKNILYKVKHITLALGILSLGSCDEILDQDVTDFGKGPDFVGFNRASVTAPFETDGEVKTYNATIDLFGPGLNEFNDEITVNVAIDPERTTAEEGVHYALAGGTTVTLNRANNFSAPIPITIYTEGIEAPVVKDLAFTITQFTTDSEEEVVISDTAKSSVISISYICFADLTGTYTMTNSVCDPQVEGMTIVKNEDGGWDLSTADGGLLQYCTSNTGLVNSGSIIVVCGEVLPSDDFGFCGSNGIGCITGGSWNEETGVLMLEHNDTFFGVGNYTSTYTRSE